ncbi:hypothetical protein [Pantoea dispersa]|uniref:Uncharacterized protein n=1 Tax=Pantoea dispersa TaxID=59814 RepID=A0ABY2ZU21_9GAMM|nr:hypothetical protein [Pantoea dispersa]TQC69981.1 hypothetical protein FK492_19830 [Pantoea dispersa]
MLTFNGAARTLIVWTTLFFAWSALVLWQFGPDIVKTIMTESNLFAFDLATRTMQGNMMPPGVITALLVLLVLTAGSVLSALTLACWNLLFFACGLPLMAGHWLQRRTGHNHTPALRTLK